MPVLCLLSLISWNSPKQLGMVSPELLRTTEHLLSTLGAVPSTVASYPHKDSGKTNTEAVNFQTGRRRE